MQQPQIIARRSMQLSLISQLQLSKQSLLGERRNWDHKVRILERGSKGKNCDTLAKLTANGPFSGGFGDTI